MSAEEQLQTLLQMYLAEYSLYATLLLTGALGALTVLQVRLAIKIKRGRWVFRIAYTTFVFIVFFSVWRLIQFSKSIDTVIQKLNLVSLHLEIQGEEAWFYSLFRSVYEYSNIVTFVITLSAGVLFFVLWREVEKHLWENSKLNSIGN